MNFDWLLLLLLSFFIIYLFYCYYCIIAAILNIIYYKFLWAKLFSSLFQVFRLQVNNGIPIKSWFDDPADCALISLLPFLETLVDADDVRPIIAKRFSNKEWCRANLNSEVLSLKPVGFQAINACPTHNSLWCIDNTISLSAIIILTARVLHLLQFIDRVIYILFLQFSSAVAL